MTAKFLLDMVHQIIERHRRPTLFTVTANLGSEKRDNCKKCKALLAEIRPKLTILLLEVFKFNVNRTPNNMEQTLYSEIYLQTVDQKKGKLQIQRVK